MTEDEMVRWHHRLNGHEFGKIPGVGDGQGGLECCDSWGRKELDTTEWLNWTELRWWMLTNCSNHFNIYNQIIILYTLNIYYMSITSQ